MLPWDRTQFCSGSDAALGSAERQLVDLPVSLHGIVAIPHSRDLAAGVLSRPAVSKDAALSRLKQGFDSPRSAIPHKLLNTFNIVSHLFRRR